MSQGLSLTDKTNGLVKTAGEAWQNELTAEGVLTHTPVSTLTMEAGAFNDLDKVLGSGVAFAAGFADQWSRDEGLPTGMRVLESAGRGLTDAASFEGGFFVGTAVSAPLGPAAPLGGLAPGVLSSMGAGALYDHLLPGPSVSQRISSAPVSTNSLAQTELNAEHQASADTTGNPAQQAQIQTNTAKGRPQLQYEAGVAGPPSTIPPASPPPGP